MKMMVLHGSPRKNGNSDTLTEYLIKGVRENGDAELKHFIVNDLSIRPCQECLICETSVNHGYTIKDDMQEKLLRIHRCRHHCLSDSNARAQIK